jgi:VanZ family protein
MSKLFTFLKQLDKQLHILGSFSLTVTLGYLLIPFGLLTAIAFAAAIVLLIGVGKEVYDYKHPLSHTADPLDFLADVIGVVVATLVLLAPHMLNLL